MEWTRIRFGAGVGLLWLVDFILYMLYMLDRVETEEFQMLSWFVMLTAVTFLIVRFMVPVQAQVGYAPQVREAILTFTLAGFIATVGVYFMLGLITHLVSRFTLAGLDGVSLLLGLTAAIHEEIFRWSCLRGFGYFAPRLRWLPSPVRQLSSSMLFVAVVVNTLWTFFHAKSYVAVPFHAWVGLWFAGMIITVCMFFSGHLLTAIAIHGLWNAAVVLQFMVLTTALVV